MLTTEADILDISSEEPLVTARKTGLPSSFVRVILSRLLFGLKK